MARSTGFGVEFDAAVLEEAGQSLPACERIADRLGERAATGELRELGFEPDAQIGDEWSGMLPRLSKRKVSNMLFNDKQGGIFV